MLTLVDTERCLRCPAGHRIVLYDVSSVRGKVVTGKGEEEIGESGKTIQPVGFFPPVLPEAVAYYTGQLGVCVGGREGERDQQKPRSRGGGGNATAHPGEGQEKHFFPALLVFLNFFTSLDYFIPRKRNS